MTYTIEHPLFQSRNAGKVHAQHCGNRSHYGRVLKNTVGLTLWEVKEKYGDKCCQVCLPTVAPKEDVAAPRKSGDLSHEIEIIGKRAYVTYWGSDETRTTKPFATEAEAQAFIAGLKAASAR